MTLLTADAVGARHTYLADARPDFRRSMASIRNAGGPWACVACESASLTCYRCSICGRDLAKTDNTTAGRER